MTGYWILPFEDNGVCPVTGQKTSDAHFTRVSEVSLCPLAVL